MALSLLAMRGLLPHDNSFFFYRSAGNSKLPGTSQRPSLPTKQVPQTREGGSRNMEQVWEAEKQWTEGRKNKVLCQGVERQEDEVRKMRGWWEDGKMKTGR